MPEPLRYSADELLALARALDDLAEATPTGLPGDDGLKMMQWCGALGGAASNLRLLAVEDYLAQTEEPLARAIEATKEARQVVADIKKVTQAFEVIGDVMLLATAIWLRKWSLVAPALKELRKDVKA